MTSLTNDLNVSNGHNKLIDNGVDSVADDISDLDDDNLNEFVGSTTPLHTYTDGNHMLPSHNSESNDNNQYHGNTFHTIEIDSTQVNTNQNDNNRNIDHRDTGTSLSIDDGDELTYSDKLLRGINSNMNEAYTLLKDSLYEDATAAQHEDIEMLDYDNPVDHLADQRLQSSDSEHGNVLISKNFKLTVLRIFITIIVGIVVGLTGYAVVRSVTVLIQTNVSILHYFIQKFNVVLAFVIILFISCSYTLISALCVTFGSWQVRGSGVGRLNAYLSGMYSSKFLTLRTLLCKIFGLILNVSAGIKHGMEGPFIHIGAMLGLHVSRAIISILKLFGHTFTIDKYIHIVSGVVDERIFITGGAAAGFSVAFNAPIAGVVYVMDGAFAYWSGDYTLRTFICTMTAVTTLNLLFLTDDVLPTRGLIDVDRPARTEIILQEFYGFAILGIIGGLAGALFTKINLMCEKWRHRHVGRKRLYNVCDVLICTVVTIIISFIIPYMFSCYNTHDICAQHPQRCLQFNCSTTQFNSLATLLFTQPNNAIRMLFERSLVSDAQIGWPILSIFCIVYFLLCCVTYNMAVPGGLFIPSIIIGASYGRIMGIIMQNIITPPTDDPQLGINPGVYAVLGSVSMLGGMTRMTLPITIMMIEITSDAQFLIPIMLVVLLAKGTADRLIGGLYAEHLKLDGLVMVFGDRLPRKLKKLTARELMSAPPLIHLSVVDTVDNVYSAIHNTMHHAFPVIESEIASVHRLSKRQRNVHSTNNIQLHRSRANSNIDIHNNNTINTTSTISKLPSTNEQRGIFLGLIQRRHISYMLMNRPCFSTAVIARDAEPLTTTLLDNNNTLYNDTLSIPSSIRQQSQPLRTPTNQSVTHNNNNINHTIELESGVTAVGANTARMSDQPLLAGNRAIHGDLHIEDSLRSNYVNLAPFIDTGAYIVSEDTSARRVWALFRSLGMRHIVVVNELHQPTGMITRHDLIHYAVA